jgi:hypothetical protein
VSLLKIMTGAESDFFRFFKIFSGIFAGMTNFYGIKGSLVV